MVTTSRSARSTLIVAQANCSATWSSNLLLFGWLSALTLFIAIVYWRVGAWPVLLLALVELAALAYALYWVRAKLAYRQVITLSEDSVRVEMGAYTPERFWLLPRRQTALQMTRANTYGAATGLALSDRHSYIPLGEFLNREESEQLAELLQAELPRPVEGIWSQRQF